MFSPPRYKVWDKEGYRVCRACFYPKLCVMIGLDKPSSSMCYECYYDMLLQWLETKHQPFT